MKILKFGGTSVGRPERMKKVAELVRGEEPKVVVLSALSGATNALVKICGYSYEKKVDEASQETDTLEAHHREFSQELVGEKLYRDVLDEIIHSHFTTIRAMSHSPHFGPKEERLILAQGEMLSTRFFYTYLQSKGRSAVLLDALDFMRINEEDEPVLSAIEDRLRPVLARYPDQSLFVTQGYICRNPLGEIDNLKRGGSDYTASLIGAAVRAEEIQIWTDIDGLHNNDPRYVENTFPLDQLSFDEAAELAYFGAKILHPSSIIPAQQYDIPVRLLNTMQPQALGTTIKSDTSAASRMIKSIAAKDNITAIKIKSSRMLLAYGFLRKVFEIFEKYKTPIDMITTSEVAVSLTIDKDEHLEEIREELSTFGTVEVDQDQSIICVVGDFVSERPEMAYRVFSALKDIPLRMISFGGSRHNISLLVNTSQKKEALNLLNEGLF